jgi:DnaJ-class molecular chaperone
MALPTDPTVAVSTRARTSALQAPDLCQWCLGSGQYLESLDCDVGHVYLPVVCESCDGTGSTGA